MRREGLVLIAVLVVITLGAMIAAGVLFRMTAEVAAGAAGSRGQQAFAAAMSGLQQAIAVLQTNGADPDIWYDNPDLFRNQLVYDGGTNRWYFTIYAHNPTDEDTVRYGVTDEAGKINLYTATEEMLLELPNMGYELVDCLMDYRDRDHETRRDGAEQDYYDRLTYPYVIRNGPLGTLDELLLIKGFDARVVYGEDANLNNLLDPNEDDGEENFPPDDRDGQLNAGLRNVATVVSYQPGAREDDETKININAGSADLSRSELPDETIEFIKLYRAEGNQFKHPSELLGMRYRLRNDPEDPGARGLKAGDWIESSVGPDELPTVMEKLSTSPPSNVPVWGLVNVNSASETVLSVLPGIDLVSARDIVDIRSSVDTETKGNLAWLYTQGAVDAETFKTVAPLLTTRGYQFHVRCVGFGSPTGRFRIIEAIVDLGGAAPRIVYLRDITSLGLPFALKPEELEL